MEMTATQAAATLRELEAAEETLTARTAGLTHLVWGLAAPLIFLTYGAAGDLVARAGAWWAYAVLWIPGTALGAILTHHLWHQHAVRLGWSDEGRGDLRVFAYVGGVLAAGAILFFGARAAGVEWAVSTAMTVANGLLAILAGLLERRGGVPCAHYGTYAGVGILLAGLTMGVLGTGEDASTILGAAATAAGWSLAGLWMLRRG